MKVALCTPCHGDPELEFAFNWVQLAVHATRHAGAEVEPFVASSSDVAGNREGLAQRALEWGADHLLWIDADQTFPRDALTYLLRSDKAVIGANIARRGRPTAPTAARIVDGRRELIWTTAEKAKAGLVEKADHLGLGFCLVAARALEGLARPLFAGPWPVREDIFFFDRLRAAGVEAYVDHRLSWQVGHVHKVVLTHEHVIADRAQWKLREQHGASRHNLPVKPAGQGDGAAAEDTESRSQSD